MRATLMRNLFTTFSIFFIFSTDLKCLTFLYSKTNILLRLFFFADSRRAIIIVDILIKFNRINTNKIKIQMNSMQMNRVLGEFVIRESKEEKSEKSWMVSCSSCVFWENARKKKLWKKLSRWSKKTRKKNKKLKLTHSRVTLSSA